MRKKKAAVFAIVAGLCLTVSGCQRTAQTGQEEQVSSEAEKSPSETPTAEKETEESIEKESETGESPEETSEEETQAEPGEESSYEIVLATDIHYLAEELAGNRCQSFINYVYGGDGRVLLYSWEILDAFIEDMKEKEPDLILLSGDLTLNGERASHEELASLLEKLDKEGIPVLVIPGNHDINNPNAKRFSGTNSYPVDSITAEEFADIYSDFGYVAADSRDPNSLSYLYKADSSLWLLMLDSCQYDPVNQVGGMIQSGTYKWMEPILYEAWEDDAEVITVSHHNLLEQSGVSDAFYDDCTIEHSEELLQMLSDNEVRLHLSGHLHLQHHMEEDDVAEVVTGSLVMAPCRYGVVDLYEDGSITYHTETVNVEKWA